MSALAVLSTALLSRAAAQIAAQGGAARCHRGVQAAAGGEEAEARAPLTPLTFTASVPFSEASAATITMDRYIKLALYAFMFVALIYKCGPLAARTAAGPAVSFCIPAMPSASCELQLASTHHLRRVLVCFLHQAGGRRCGHRHGGSSRAPGKG